MTIRDLIRDLQSLPLKSEVVISHHEDGDLPVTYAIRPDGIIELYGDWDALIEEDRLRCAKRVGKVR